MKGAPRKRPRHLEDTAQANLFAWLRVTRFGGRSVADLAWHTPNGGRRNLREAARLKRMGVLAGVPDVTVAIPAGGYHGLFVELKAGKNRATATQAELHELLREQGYRVEVATGWTHAAGVIAAYLGIRGP